MFWAYICGKHTQEDKRVNRWTTHFTSIRCPIP